MRLLLGLIKGAIIGGVLGYGAYAAGLGGAFHWITYGLVGALVGLLVGRPVWSHLKDKKSTVATPVVKAVVGFGVACGLYAIVAKVWGGANITIGSQTHNLYDWPYILGAAIGGVYGALVEADDAVAPAARESGK